MRQFVIIVFKSKYILVSIQYTLLQKHNVRYELRDKNKLIQNKFKTVTYGKRSFIWVPSCGTLPIGIKDAISLNNFKERIKS